MAKMNEPKAKRARKPNYTHQEITVLLEEVATNKVVIQSTLTSEVTNQQKGQLWQLDTAKKLSNCGVCLRTQDQVREKLSGMKKDFFVREKRKRGTGGGPPIHDKPFDKLLTFIAGKDSALFSGLCVPMAAKTCRTPRHQIQMVPADDTSLVETSMPAAIHSTPKRMIQASGSHSDGTFVPTSSLDQQALQEPFLQVQLQDAAVDPELEPVQLLHDITAIQDMAGPALEGQSTLSKSRKSLTSRKRRKITAIVVTSGK